MSSTANLSIRALLAATLILTGVCRAHCPAPAATLLERFIPADCEACWSTAERPPDATWILDWIVPSPRGDAAPLSAAAIAEATARAGAMTTTSTRQRRHALAPRGLQLTVEQGPAWNGYIALRLRATRSGPAWPGGASGFIALVEDVAAGDEGTPVPRRVVRAVVGPLTLEPDSPGTTHVVAVRLPSGSRVDRLDATAWIEDGTGAIVAAAQADPAECAPATR